MRLLVIGAGISGRAAARLGRRLGGEVVVYDRYAAPLRGLEDLETWSGPWDRRLLRRVELVVASPGVPEHARPIQDALAGPAPVVSELEYAARHLEARVVGVTGTNGKTTVTGLVAAMLVRSGHKAVAAGNIGLALSDVVGEPWDVVAVEASSFQLRFCDTFHPGVAVYLNLAPDHLDWHNSFAAYAAAKARIFARQEAHEPLIYDADDPGAAGAVAAASSRLVPVSGRRRPPGGFGPGDGALVLPGLEMDLAELPTPDPTATVDLVAAGVAALEAGAAPEAVAEELRRFTPGPHRRARISRRGGIDWVDDSKATNPHAAAASAAAFPSVVLLAGGRNKGLDLSPLASIPTVRAIIAFGEAAPEIAAAAPEALQVPNLAAAVVAAGRTARPGDTVLLAPGCASFDEFGSYAERGRAFAAAVTGLNEEGR